MLYFIYKWPADMKKFKFNGAKDLIIYFLAFICLNFLLSKQTWAVTEVGGIISTNTTWRLNNSPYRLTNTVQIAENITLTIEPGVIINGEYNGIEVWGSLYAVGTSSSSIIFNDIGLRIADTATAASINVQHAELNNSGIGSFPGRGSLILKDSKLKNGGMRLWYLTDIDIERNIFSFVGSSWSILWIYPLDYSYINIKNNVFYYQYGTGIVVDGYGVGTFIIEYNSFLNTNTLALKLEPNRRTSISATNNYWNTTDTTVIDSMIYDKNDDLSTAGYIDYIPILISPHPDTPQFTPQAISISPSSIDFNEVYVHNTSTPSTINIYNSGDINLNVVDLTLSDTSNYVLNVSVGTNPCGSTTPVIPAGGSCTVSVTFTPQTTGTLNATLMLSSNDPDTPNLAVALTGNGVIDETDNDTTSNSEIEKNDTDVNGGSSGGGGCFIATAAYGSYLDPRIKILRDFRDEHLLTNYIGRIFIKIYYKTSPPIANFISTHETMRAATRLALTPLIYGLQYPKKIFLIIVVGFIIIPFVLRIKSR